MYTNWSRELRWRGLAPASCCSSYRMLWPSSPSWLEPSTCAPSIRRASIRLLETMLPPFDGGLLVMIGLLLSGLAYYVWDRRASKAGETGQTLFFLLSLLIMLAAAVGETWIGATLRYGVPIQAYESVHLLITWFTAVHLWLAAIIGILLVGRILRGRVAGHEFVVEVTG